MTTECATLRRHLDAFADGELRGALVLRVLNHLRTCRACADRVDEVRRLGELLRASAPAGLDTRVLAGLAGTVVSRTRAESDASWSAMLHRASEDWHWALVAGGAVAATLVVTVVAGLLLTFGPTPRQDKSLAAVVAKLAAPTPCGYLFLEVTPAGTKRAPMLAQVDDGCPDASAETIRLASYAPSEEEMVGALFDTITKYGPHTSVNDLTPSYRQFAEGLTSSIADMQVNGAQAEPGGPRVRDVGWNVHRVRYLSFTRVTAKGGA